MKTTHLTLALLFLGCGPDSDFAADGGSQDAHVDTPIDGGNLADSGPDTPGHDAGQSDGNVRDTGTPEMGEPGCGFEAAAFCETFDEASPGGRAGDLDDARWAASRMRAEVPTRGGPVFSVGTASLRPVRRDESGPAQLPECRPGLPEAATPTHDSLICEPNENIASGHFLASVSAQNYGQHTYRIQTPFDFRGRTGEIHFDTELMSDALLGWVSVEVSQDPTPTPGFARQHNFEGTPIPRNGFAFNFVGRCGGHGFLTVFDGHTQTEAEPDEERGCVSEEWGHLNRVSIRVSASRFEVFATDASEDGVNFGDPVRVFSAPVSLPIEGGYVSITVHNHATQKYSTNERLGFQGLESWIARWDNVGFDGPIVAPRREFNAADNLESDDSDILLGWSVPDAEEGTRSIVIPGVDRAAAAAAQVSLLAYFCRCSGVMDPSTHILRYRLNGAAWQERRLSEEELIGLEASATIGLMLDVPVGDIVEGDNTLELATRNVSQRRSPEVANVTLMLE